MFMSFTKFEARIRVSGALVITASLVTISGPAAQSAVQCKAAGTLVRVAELPEGSGLAASQRTPGRLWSHNDSGDPVVARSPPKRSCC